MKIAYLASKSTLPGNDQRRADAIEHDQMMDALRPAFKKQQMCIEDVAWDAPDVDWSVYSAIVIGTTWDYCDQPELFLQTLDTINKITPVLNPVPLVKWNMNKTYLRQLAQKGAQLIPTLWVDNPVPDEINRCFDKLQTDVIVVKQQVGANAEGQYKLELNQPIPQLTKPMMVQPFLSRIVDEGEYSFIFVGDVLVTLYLKNLLLVITVSNQAMVVWNKQL